MKFNISILLLSFCALVCTACGSGSEQTNPAEQEPAPTADTTPEAAATTDEKVILFFGNSLTAGYGLETSQAFPALIQQRLDSLGYSYKVVNAGLSGETTAGGNKRLEWVLERQPVDIFVLELGANDGLRGIDPASTRQNLEEMIDKVRKANPEVKVILTGMMVPPSMGQEFSTSFREVFPEVARKKEVALVPFILEGVAGERELNQSDGIHPTAAGQKILAQNVWKVLKDHLEKP